MIESGKTYLVMGLLDPHSIAYAIGERIRSQGGHVRFTVQNERMKRIFLDRSKVLSQEEREKLDIDYCDVTDEEQVKGVFDRIDSLGGVVHSIAYANPKTSLGEEFHTDAMEDLKQGFHISAASLATVAKYAQPLMPKDGGIVALSFAAMEAFPYYNWMGVNKAALEAVVRALARRHGKDRLRVNALSSGPLDTKAASSIPGFEQIGEAWNRRSPLPWDPVEDRYAVADTATFLLSDFARRITGQTVYVDGGASVMGGDLLPHEQPESP